MNHSQLQQHSPGSSQNLTLNNDAKAIRDFLKELEKSLPLLSLDSSDNDAVQEKIAVIEKEVASSQPKNSFIAESLKILRSILEKATGSGIGAVLGKWLITQIDNLFV